MKRNIGIWIDSKQAVVINYSPNETTLKTIPSNIETRVREAGESKKYGRFGGQYLTYEKNRLMKRNLQTNQFIKLLSKEILKADAVVIFGPSRMKIILEKEIRKNMQLEPKLKGVFNAEAITENQMKAWVRDFYAKKK